MSSSDTSYDAAAASFSSSSSSSILTILNLESQLATLRSDAAAKEREHRAAREEIRNLQDVIKLKDKFADSVDRQLTNAASANDLLTQQLASVQSQLLAIEADRAEHPLSDTDLLFRYENLVRLFDTIREALTCNVCYEFYAKGTAVSLLCGHSFCEPCYVAWEARHLDAFKLSPQQGAYKGADCPECRSLSSVRRGRVRIWALEEVVRLVEKGAKEMVEKVFVPVAAEVGAKEGQEQGEVRPEAEGS